MYVLNGINICIMCYDIYAIYIFIVYFSLYIISKLYKDLNNILCLILNNKNISLILFVFYSYNMFV